MNSIFQDYYGEEVSLTDYHRQYFEIDSSEIISFNKSLKLIIVAQKITKEIKQAALYLRKRGIDIYCMEFKIFENESQEKIITCDYIVGDEDALGIKPVLTSLPKVSEESFKKSIDEYGKIAFNEIFNFINQFNLKIKCGYKGFSVNLELEEKYICLFVVLPPQSVFKQCILTRFEIIENKVNNGDEIVKYYEDNIKKLGYFIKVGKNYNNQQMQEFLNIIKNEITMINNNGLK